MSKKSTYEKEAQKPGFVEGVDAVNEGRIETFVIYTHRASDVQDINAKLSNGWSIQSITASGEGAYFVFERYLPEHQD